MCRLTAFVALLCLVFATCGATLLASPQVANTELAPLSLRTDETLDCTPAQYGKVHRAADRLSQNGLHDVMFPTGLQTLRSRASSEKPGSSVQSANRVLSTSSSGLGAPGPDASRSPASTIPPLSPIRTRVVESTSGLSSVNTHHPGSNIPSAASPPSSNTHGSHTSGSELRRPWPSQGPRLIGKSALDDDADSHEAKVESKRLFPKKPSKLKRHSNVLRKARRSKVMKRPGSFKVSRFVDLLSRAFVDEPESIDARLFASHQDSLDLHHGQDQGLKRTRSASTADIWSLSSLNSALASDDERDLGVSHISAWQHFANGPSPAYEHDQGPKRTRTSSFSSLDSADDSDDSDLTLQRPKKKPKSGGSHSSLFTTSPAQPTDIVRNAREKKLGNLKAYKASLSKITGGVKKPPLKMHRIFAHGMLRRAVLNEERSRIGKGAEPTLAPRYAKHPVKYMKMLWKAEAKRKSPVKVIHKVQSKKIAKKKGSDAVIVAPHLPYSRVMPMTKQGRPRKPFQSYRASLAKLHKERTSSNVRKYHASRNLLAKKLKIWKRGDSKAEKYVSLYPTFRERVSTEISPAAVSVTLTSRGAADEVPSTSDLMPRVAQSGWKYVANAINKARRRRRPLHRLRDKKISKSKGLSMIITAPNLPYSRLTPITKQQWPPKPFQSYRNSLDRLRKSRGKNTDEWMSFLRPASGKVGKQKKGGFLSSGVFVAKPRRKPGLIPFGASKTELLSSKLDRPMGSSSEVLSGATAKGKEAMIPSPRRNPPRKARPDRYSTLGQEESGSMSSTLVG